MFLKKMVVAMAMILSFGNALADIQISDTYIDFKSNTDFSVSLVNTGLSIDSYKFEILDWKQESGYIDSSGKVIPIKNVYSESKGGELVVFPSNLVLRPSQNNTIRLRVKDDEAKKKNAYRLEIKELDKKFPGNRVASNQINIKLSHRIPVFMNNSEKTIKQLDVQYSLIEKYNKYYLYIKNMDSKPLFINNIIQGNKDESIGYVFPGIETYYDLAGFDINKPVLLKDRSTERELLLILK